MSQKWFGLGSGDGDSAALIEACRKIYKAEDAGPSGYADQQKDYEKSWSIRLDKIMKYIEGGEVNISELFARYRNYWMTDRWAVGQQEDFICADSVVRLFARSGYVFYRNAVADAVVAAAEEDTVSVIELGSGIGESLFTVWGEGRLRRPRYHACEISSSGRKASRIIAALDPRLRLEAHHFDYRQPSLANLRVKSGHALVFSTHSVEQVEQLPEQLIEEICALAPKVTVLHFEPVGWQFAPDPSAAHVAAHHERCTEFGYNKNLWSLLGAARQSGKVEIREAVPYFFGLLYNPSCKIVWAKR